MLEREKLEFFESVMSGAYLLIQWPDSQDYMDKDWFDSEGIFGNDSSVFVPLQRILDEVEYLKK